MVTTNFQTVDLTEIVRRLEEPAKGVLVRIIDRTFPFTLILGILAISICLLAPKSNLSAVRTASFILAIVAAFPYALMIIIWFRHGVDFAGRLKRLRGMPPLRIDGVDYDLTDLERVFKKLTAKLDSVPSHQPPRLIERLAIGVLFGAPLAFLIVMFVLNPAPRASSSWFAHSLFGFDIGFYYLLIAANSSRGKHAWARTLLNQWRRAAGYLSCLAATAIIMVVLFNIFIPTDNMDKDHPAATYPLFAAMLFILSPKLFGDRPNGTATDVMNADRRAPVLFLRSFEDEGIAVSSSMLWSFQSGQKVRFYLMVMLRHWLESIGPVVAIADPANPVPPMADAAREEVTDEEWRRVAADLMKRAAMIVMMGGRTDGTGWEMRHIVANDHLDKLLLFFPPPQDWRNISAADRWQNLLASFDGSPLWDELAKMDADRVRAIAFKSGEHALVFLSQTAVDMDYELAGLLGLLTLLHPTTLPTS